MNASPMIAAASPPRDYCRYVRSAAAFLSMGLPLGVVAQTSTTPKEPQDLRVALSRDAFRDTSVNDATAAYRVFVETIARNHGYNARVSTEIFDDRAEFAEALARDENPIHLSIIMAWDFLQMEIPESMTPQYVVQENEGPGRRFLLLANLRHGAKTIADLRGRSLVRWKFADTGLINDWIETLLYEADIPAAGGFFSEIAAQSKASQVILPVFFGTKDACVIDEPSFKLMGELNPQVAKNLTVIASTDTLADVVICLREDGWENADFRQMIVDGINELQDSSEGRQILTLFRIQNFLPYKPEELDTSRDLLERWKRTQTETAP